MSSLRPQWLDGLVDASTMYSWASYHFARTLFTSLRQGIIPLSSTQWQKIRDSSFSDFWLAFSAPSLAASPDAPVSNSASLVPLLLQKASGVVLDLGPGSGSQMPHLRSPEIKTIYGAEPCTGLHDQLLAQATRFNMQDKYKILSCSAELEPLVSELEQHGLITEKNDTGVFDTVISVRVLCSVPNPEQTISDLYALLRPGGKMLICEHVVNPWRNGGSFVARCFQFLFMKMGWSFLIGDCCLDRDTMALLVKAAERDGGWEENALEVSAEYCLFPYVFGYLVKKGAAQ
ncbi:hypothetical protein BDV25DRAFT_125842 [Aspergillus avenaceus]|uniref:S-adenosyl-L-methionine-dependent methyltransferase n=1 Tax=Aspergillus avenaceus TaxID=36643 RepID=A0A5N6TT66_ASPAV|nr:hypothetical protein BDV25DRAFT_125842 [Aspergillus avenaceus]